MSASMLQLVPLVGNTIYAQFMCENDDGSLALDYEIVRFAALAKYHDKPDCMVSIIVSGGAYAIAEEDENFCGVCPADGRSGSLSEIEITNVPYKYRNQFEQWLSRQE